jgi:hypothetical protein
VTPDTSEVLIYENQGSALNGEASSKRYRRAVEMLFHFGVKKPFHYYWGVRERNNRHQGVVADDDEIRPCCLSAMQKLGVRWIGS